MTLHKFFRNILDVIESSFFLTLTFMTFAGLIIVTTVAFIVSHPTVETFTVLGTLLFVRLVYAGFTRK